MKIEITPDKCIACGICNALCPTIFDYTDEGIVKLDMTPDLTVILPADDTLRTIQTKCPTQAIKIS